MAPRRSALGAAPFCRDGLTVVSRRDAPPALTCHYIQPLAGGVAAFTSPLRRHDYLLSVNLLAIVNADGARDAGLNLQVTARGSGGFCLAGMLVAPAKWPDSAEDLEIATLQDLAVPMQSWQPDRGPSVPLASLAALQAAHHECGDAAFAAAADLQALGGPRRAIRRAVVYTNAVGDSPRA